VVITAVKDLKIKKGSTKPHAFECDDGRTYLVKFKDGTRTVINEHIGYSLARFLELPVPESRQVVVSRELIDSSEGLRKREIAAGIHHGSLLLDGCVDFGRITAQSLPLTNADCLPGLIVLDNLHPSLPGSKGPKRSRRKRSVRSCRKCQVSGRWVKERRQRFLTSSSPERPSLEDS
jgi:hypothetical protein